MSPFWSRILVAVLGLPAVLGLVWLGGWWLWGLAAVASIAALHELYSMVRRLRPLVLAGYGGALLALVGALLGGVDWMLAGFLATFLLSFALFGISDSRQPATVAMGATLMGVSWIGLGMGHLILLRELGTPSMGRYAAFAVLLAVWADDTVAYFAGRLIGRHRLAPTLSPGKTLEGFVFGSAAAILVAFFTLYKNGQNGFMDGWRPIVLGAVIATSGAVGDLFESALKRDMEVKDTGRLLAGHGGVLDRIDALLFATVAGFYTILALS
jgi:phosphatidate cytidylyltransferase